MKGQEDPILIFENQINSNQRGGASNEEYQKCVGEQATSPIARPLASNLRQVPYSSLFADVVHFLWSCFFRHAQIINNLVKSILKPHYHLNRSG